MLKINYKYVLIIALSILTAVACVDDKVINTNTEVIERVAGSETFFLVDTAQGHNPEENAIRIGGVIAIDLEARNEILADSVIDSFEEQPGTDIVKISIVNEGTYHFRIDEGIDIDIELIDPFNSTVFRISPTNPTFSGVLQPGKYGLKLYNNLDYSSELDNRQLIFFRPDKSLLQEDPLGILAEIPQGNLESDHYMVFQEGSCNECDLSYGFFDYFTFHHLENETVSLNGIRAEDASFKYAKMNDVEISGEFFTKSDFSYADLRRSYFHDIAEMSHVNFDRAKFNSAVFGNISGRFTSFEYCDMRRMVGYDFSLKNSSWIDCIAIATDFQRGDFTGTDFTYLKAGNSVFSDVIFTGSDMTSADLVGSDLSGSNFTNVQLTDANITNANVTGAIFCRVFQYRNFSARLAIGISEAECLLELIEKVEKQNQDEEQ